ncbi:hypothetical protein ACJQWK_00206 [Exserohilum turcicum]|uniref:Uncharacterized protein n=1 Tax=Exserohilum turcicum (strain 28A) TaxID=671987 RepID=R0ID50_EXST2|nr:uncharacterized protein SETTUDRAFT_164712 [Exserohilum turcica Et28A]EOA83290.1 hypothetical protein SETTUDRAFT_164712 [Exserohilum turcica Et28A]
MATPSQPMPLPVRTNTTDSQQSRSSAGQFSLPGSPSCHSNRTEESFFGALSARLRGRSHSRSRDATLHNRTKSPMPMPPVHSQHSTSTSRPSPTPVQNARLSTQSTTRRNTSGSDPWRGRHSNDWLFNGYSVTASAKEFLQRRK